MEERKERREEERRSVIFFLLQNRLLTGSSSLDSCLIRENLRFFFKFFLCGMRYGNTIDIENERVTIEQDEQSAHCLLGGFSKLTLPM